MMVRFITRPPGIAFLVASLDRSLARLSVTQPPAVEVERLRWFWLDGLFSTISVSFYASFVTLFALAYGANNTEIGRLTAVASLCGLAALLPGAQAIKLMGGRRKTVVVLFGGIIARVALLAWVVLPLMTHDSGTAIAVIIVVNAVITFANNFANPAWTAIVADIVPREIRGRFFSHRNFAVNLPALLIVPLAGLLIQAGNRPGAPFAGYQLVFILAFVSGIVATLAFARIDDPVPASQARQPLRLGELVRTIRSAPGFLGLVVCTLIWSLGVQIVAPFLNVYLVNDLGATTAMVGWITAASSLAALLTAALVGPLGRQEGKHLGARGVVLHHTDHTAGLDGCPRPVAGGPHQRHGRHLVDRLWPGELQLAAGYGAGEERAPRRMRCFSWSSPAAPRSPQWWEATWPMPWATGRSSYSAP